MLWWRWKEKVRESWKAKGNVVCQDQTETSIWVRVSVQIGGPPNQEMVKPLAGLSADRILFDGCIKKKRKLVTGENCSWQLQCYILVLGYMVASSPENKHLSWLYGLLKCGCLVVMASALLWEFRWRSSLGWKYPRQNKMGYACNNIRS